MNKARGRHNVNEREEENVLSVLVKHKGGNGTESGGGAHD